MFEIPSFVKPAPNSQWVWELQKRIETAHTLVRQTMQREMHRQKLIHDICISYEKFQKGEQVLVFFPVKQIGTSSKLTQFWKGPFKIVDKISDLLYKVNCGKKGSDQVIHCDRIRACKKQLLAGENEFDDNEMNEESLDEANDEDNRSGEDSREQEVVNDGKRIHRKPVWAKDYVFSCRTNMVKTKTTERKPPMQICLLCKALIPRSETFENHVLRCSKERVTCGQCGKIFKKRAYLVKHEHTQHASNLCALSISQMMEKNWIGKRIQIYLYRLAAK